MRGKETSQSLRGFRAGSPVSPHISHTSLSPLPHTPSPSCCTHASDRPVVARFRSESWVQSQGHTFPLTSSHRHLPHEAIGQSHQEFEEMQSSTLALFSSHDDSQSRGLAARSSTHAHDDDSGFWSRRKGMASTAETSKEQTQRQFSCVRVCEIGKRGR